MSCQCRWIYLIYRFIFMTIFFWYSGNMTFLKIFEMLFTGLPKRNWHCQARSEGYLHVYIYLTNFEKHELYTNNILVCLVQQLHSCYQSWHNFNIFDMLFQHWASNPHASTELRSEAVCEADWHGRRRVARQHQLSLPDLQRRHTRPGLSRRSRDGDRVGGIPHREQRGVWLVRCPMHHWNEKCKELNILTGGFCRPNKNLI